MVSRMTIYRKVECGLVEPHSDISEQQLMDIIRNLVTQHPQVGQSFMWGRLKSLGYPRTSTFSDAFM